VPRRCAAAGRCRMMAYSCRSRCARSLRVRVMSSA
jgi:hypothetical protein